MEITTLIEAALVWIAIIVLCIVSPRARLIVAGVFLVIGTLLRIGVSSGYHDNDDWPPPWRRHRRRF